MIIIHIILLITTIIIIFITICMYIAPTHARMRRLLKRDVMAGELASACPLERPLGAACKERYVIWRYIHICVPFYVRCNNNNVCVYIYIYIDRYIHTHYIYIYIYIYIKCISTPWRCERAAAGPCTQAVPQDPSRRTSACIETCAICPSLFIKLYTEYIECQSINQSINRSMHLSRTHVSMIYDACMRACVCLTMHPCGPCMPPTNYAACRPPCQHTPHPATSSY